MIQQHRFGTGLNKYVSQIKYRDQSSTSEHYFRILDAPDRLYVGKTSFRLRANLDTLVQGSTIYIDIVDSAGNTIYHEIVDFIGKDKSRLIVAHVYENTAPGEAMIYIAGRIKYNMSTGEHLEYNDNADSWDYKHYPNVLWSKKVVVIPSAQNDSEILFLQSPDVTCHERTEYFSTAPVSQRKKTVLSTGSEAISLKTTVQPYQYVNTSRYATTYNEGGKYLDLDPSGSSAFIKSQQIQVPEHFGFNVIRSSEFNFNKDFVGGKITVKNPNGLDTVYSASVVKVIDKNTIQVDAPFNYNDGDQNISTILSATDFTASYITRDINFTTYETESFIQLDFKGLEPIAGSVDRVRVSYKPYGTFGEFISVGEFPLKEQNYLTDSGSLLADKVAIIEQPIGDLSGSYSYDIYWSLVSNPLLNLYTSIEDSFTLDRGGSLFFTSSTAVTSSRTDYLAYLKLNESYSISSINNTEFKLQLSTRYTEQDTYTNILSDYENQQIDVFISGAGVIADEQHTTKINSLLKTKQFGTYVGSITTHKSNTQLDSKFYFKTTEDGPITPVFVVRSGNGWEFKEIILAPRNELGYSPNQGKLMVPINTLKTNMELVLKLEYLAANGKKADIETVLYGLNFSGSGFPKDRLFTNSGIVSSSQQYATGSYTGSFYGDFFGIPTGSPTIQYYRTHTQTTPSMTWSFGHGLSWRYPLITVWNENNEVMIPEKIHANSVYETLIYFPVPKSGVASATIGSIMPTGSLHFDNLLGKPTLISSSQQIAADISGSWSSTSSSFALEKINKIGDNAFSSSAQVNIFHIQNSSYHNITELYCYGYNSTQTATLLEQPIQWSDPFVTFNPDAPYWISSSYILLTQTGSYEIDTKIKFLNPNSIVQVYFAESIDGSGSFNKISLYSGSIPSDATLHLNYYYRNTGSNNRIGFRWVGINGTSSIAPESAATHSYFKVIRMKSI